ncbi:MAG: GNAT family N-acetyltransferase [Paracoccaceae bacterium]
MDEIRTERLIWRLPEAADFEALHMLVSDFDVIKWTGSWPSPADEAFTRRRCKPMNAERGFSGFVFLEGDLIGTMGIEQGELGYMFARDHWGFGYATEIGTPFVNRAFEMTAWKTLTARVGQDNAGSARVLEKLGFERTGAGRCGSAAQGKELDSFEYELIRTRWKAFPPINPVPLL